MISAIVLAAGQSRRMGRNKMLLPYGGSTVIETVIAEIAACGSVVDTVVVTGCEHERLESLLVKYPLRCVFNPDYARAEMIVSIQVGLRAMPDNATAALIALGDQPRIQHDMVRRVNDAYAAGLIVIPSFARRRGHPILLDRSIWPDVLALPPEATLRDLIRAHEDRIHYVEVESDSVIRDIDTPNDYRETVQRRDAESAESS